MCPSAPSDVSTRAVSSRGEAKEEKGSAAARTTATRVRLAVLLESADLREKRYILTPSVYDIQASSPCTKQREWIWVAHVEVRARVGFDKRSDASSPDEISTIVTCEPCSEILRWLASEVASDAAAPPLCYSFSVPSGDMSQCAPPAPCLHGADLRTRARAVPVGVPTL